MKKRSKSGLDLEAAVKEAIAHKCGKMRLRSRVVSGGEMDGRVKPGHDKGEGSVRG